MTKRTAPSQSYLKTLEEDLDIAKFAFNLAKVDLYKLTATAKLGEPAFEMARSKALEANKAVEKVEAEILRVQKAL